MILMHLFIGLTMQLYAFSIIMIVWNIVTFGELSLVKKEKKLENNRQNSIKYVFLILVYIFCKFIMPKKLQLQHIVKFSGKV